MKGFAKQIFLWVETIASARILLFVMPVMITQRFKTLYGLTVDDLFITLLGLVGFYGCVLGILGLRGFKAAVWLHGLLGAFLVLACVAFFFALKQAGQPVHLVYLLPLIIAAGMTSGFVIVRPHREETP